MSIPNSTLPILSTNNPIVTSIGSTQADANMLLYGSNNPLTGYSIGVNNSGLYIIGKNTPTQVTVGSNAIHQYTQNTLNIIGNINATNIYNNGNLIVDSNKNFYVPININTITTTNQIVNPNVVLLGRNFGIYRNRILNGAMNIDSLNTSTYPVVLNSRNTITSIESSSLISVIGYSSTLQQPITVNTLDNWQMIGNTNSASLVATQVPLNTTDIATTGGKFTNAVSLSTLPVNGLISYLPFNNSLNDSLGYLTVDSSSNIKYSTSNVAVGNFSLDLSSNIAGSSRTNTSVSYTLPNTLGGIGLPLTFSFWAYNTSNSTTNQTYFSFVNNAARTSGLSFDLLNNALYINNLSIGVIGQTTQTSAYISTSTSILNTRSTFTSVISTTQTSILGWNHFGIVLDYNTQPIVYYNGVNVAMVPTNANTSSTLPAYGNILTSNYALTNILRIGTNGAFTQPNSMYIDDYRMYNRALTQTEINILANNTGIFQIPTFPTPGAPAGAERIYRFESNLNEAFGGTALTAIGNVSYVPGIVNNNALYIPNEANVGANTKGVNYVQTTAYNLAASSNITISFWFNQSYLTFNAATYSEIWEFGLNANGAEYMFLYTKNSQLVASVAGGTYYYTSPYTINYNTWYHVVVEYVSGNSLNIYVNGMFWNSVSTPNTSSSWTSVILRIGESTVTTLARAFAGYVDDFRIYSRILSASEIAGLYYGSLNTPYTLYNQPIPGYNLSDWGWGTPNAQTVNLSAWLENISTSSQSFTLSLNNATNMLLYLPFENSIADATDQYSVVTKNWTPTYVTDRVVGNYAIYFNNTSNLYATQYLDLPVQQFSFNAPISLSFWFNYRVVPSATYVSTLFTYGGNYNAANPFTININRISSGSNVLSINYNIKNANNVTSQYGSNIIGSISTNTWYHLAVTYDSSTLISYINGQHVNDVDIIGQFTQLGNISTSIPIMRIGDNGNIASNTSTLYGGFNGYIDDFRIYGSVLTPAQITQIYNNNAFSTSISQYLLPRSILFNTPTINANSWCNINVSIPGDTTGYWNTSSTTGLNIGVCLGASSNYNYNVINTWTNNTVAYTANNTQIYGSSSNTFLGNPANSLYITGVQLEIGTQKTPYENKPPALENIINADNTVIGSGNGNLNIGSTTQVTQLLNVPITIPIAPPTGPYYGNISANNMNTFRNILINGNMNIAQRAVASAITSTTISTGSFNTYLIDKWYVSTSNITSGSAIYKYNTLNKSTDLPVNYGINNSLVCSNISTLASTSSYSHVYIGQNIEANLVNTLLWGSQYGVPLTLSFWTRTNLPIGSLVAVALRNNNATGLWYVYNTYYTVNVIVKEWQYVV